MKRFEAFYKNDTENNHLLQDGKVFGKEARFDIIAESEARALELIDQEKEDSSKFYLEEMSGFVKDQMGKYFPESIRDARI
jgi:hypothetical protein